MSLKSEKNKNEGKKNILEKLGKKITLNKVQKISLSIIFALVLIAFVLTLIFFVRNNKRSLIKENTILDPELARAMTYERFEDGDDAVYEVDENDNITDNVVDNVKFSAFFSEDIDKDGYIEKMKGTCKSISSFSNLRMELKVQTDGYLKDGKIEIDGENFTYSTTLTEDGVIGENIAGTCSEILLNSHISAGAQKIIQGKIVAELDENLNSYSRENHIILTGVFVDSNGIEKQIKKVVDLQVDWHGYVRTVVNRNYYNKTKYNDYSIQRNKIESLIENEQIVLNFRLVSSEINKQLILKENQIIATLPEINGYEPSKVYVNGNDARNNYNMATRELTLTKIAEVNEDEFVIVPVESNVYYNVKVYYPKELYETIEKSTLSLTIPVSAYYEGFNNKNEEFVNPQRSEASGVLSIVYDEIPKGDIWATEVKVGDYFNSDVRMISKEKPIAVYNGNPQGSKDLYNVEWIVNLNKIDSVDKIILEEPLNGESRISDRFVSGSGNTSMRDYIAIKEIFISGADSMLGPNGWIKVLNGDTEEEIVTLNKANQYRYSIVSDVKSIKLETSEIVAEGIMHVDLKKDIDDKLLTENISLNSFNNYKYIHSDLKATIFAKEGKAFDNNQKQVSMTKSDVAHYEELWSSVSFSTDVDTYKNESNQEVTFNINAKRDHFMNSYWKNGIFLIELPEEFLRVNVKECKVTSYGNTNIDSYIAYKHGKKWIIKIITQNTNLVSDVNIKVITEISPNPLLPTIDRKATLYAFNEECTNYEKSTYDKYDINNNSKTYDNVGCADIDLHFVAPTGLVTAETISNYDTENSIAVSPDIAEIETSKDAKTAKVNISLTNNYNETISDVSIIGRTFYEGNKYLLANKELKSQYTAKMISSIAVPTNIQNRVSVYYSTQEEVTPSLENSENGWTLAEQVENWENIKSYLILFNNYRLSSKESITFSYDIQVPGNLDYESISYGTHAVFFSVNFAEGKYRTSVEPPKIGVRIVRKYDLELHKTKKAYENMNVGDSIYSLDTHDDAYDDENAIVSRIAMTDENGILNFNEINAGRIYILREIQTNKDYSINPESITFKAEYDEDDNLNFEILEGSFKNEVLIEKNGSKSSVKANVEDESRYTLEINKLDNNGEAVTTAKFTFKDGEQEKTVYSGATGKIIFENLEIGKDYSIREESVKGCFIDKADRVFRLERNDIGKLYIESEDEFFKNAVIEEQEGVAQAKVRANIINEKIPTFDLEIIKVEEDVTVSDVDRLKKIANAKFTVESMQDHDIEEYTTDSEGIARVSGLYEVIEGRNDENKYIIKETKAPLGYTPNEEEIKISVSKNIDNELEAKIENKNELDSLRKVIIDGGTVKVYIQDKPLFKLSKVDKDTNEPLEGVKFEIYEIAENGEIIDFAKDPNGNFVGLIDENNKYYVVTDENGTISLPLRKGLYKAVELNTPEGYEKNLKEEIFEVAGEQLIEESEDTYDDVITEEIKVEYEEKDDSEFEVVEINNIEDLVDLSNESKTVTKEKIKISLKRTLDFNDDSSYENAQRTDYGDINENGTVESLKTELTTEKGFYPIAFRTAINNFVVDGNNNKLENLYINRNDYSNVGLIGGTATDGEFKNIEISGTIYSTSSRVGGFVGLCTSQCAFINCINNINISVSSANSYTYIGGFAGYINGKTFFINGENKGNITITQNYSIYAGGLCGYTNAESKIYRTKNSGDIINKPANSSFYAGGLIGYSTANTILECENVGKIESISEESNGTKYLGGLIGYSNSYNKIKDCTNTGKIEATNSGNGTVYVGGYVGYGSSYIWLLNLKYVTTIDVKDYTVYCGGMVGYENGNLIAINNEIDGTFNLTENENYIYWGGVAGYVAGNIDIYNAKVTKGFELESDNKINYLYAGGLVGYTKASSTKIYNSIIYNGNITLTKINTIYLGGLIGVSGINNEILQCENYANFNISILSSGYVGGLVGELLNNYSTSNTSMLLKNCINEGNIFVIQPDGNGYAYVGGICGQLDAVTAEKCVNKGNISTSANQNYVGGIVGYTGKTVNCDKCNNYGTIDVKDTYDSYIGGIVGGHSFGRSGIIQNCNNKGKILFDGHMTSGSIGGIIAEGASSVINCNNFEEIHALTEYTIWIGGIVGRNGNVTNCNNYGDVYAESSWHGYPYVGGIISYGGTITNCNNYGNVTCLGYFNPNVGGIGSGSIKNCRNAGNIKVGAQGYLSVAGVSSGGSNIVSCVNSGNIEIVGEPKASDISIGGISVNGTVSYCKNEGNIYCSGTGTIGNNIYTFYVGGIVASGYSYYSYNTGDVIVNSKKSYVGPITGNASTTPTNSYYLENVNIQGKYKNNNGYKVSRNELQSESFVNKIGGDNYWVYQVNEYPDVLITGTEYKPIQSTELVITNKKKEFVITTEVKNNLGGNISGEDLIPYERVLYKNNSKNIILMQPSTNYEITNVEINGQDIAFNANSDGTMQLEQFEDVEEDKHVIVTYGKSVSNVTINKIDKESLEGIKDVEFLISQLSDERENADSNVIGNLVSTSPKFYSYAADINREVEGRFNSLSHYSGSYDFVEQNGKYIPTNSKTYCLEHGGTEGIKSSKATGYIPIDLRDLEGYYKLVVNAEMSSGSRDYSTITVNNDYYYNSTNPTVNDFDILYRRTGTVSARDYEMKYALKGGKIYYLHFIYEKGTGSDVGNDYLAINSVKLYETNRNEGVTYNYSSQGNNNYRLSVPSEREVTVSGYIPIDLSSSYSNYTLSFTESASNIMYTNTETYLTETEELPEDLDTVDRLVSIGSSKNYVSRTVYGNAQLDGGRKYYLHFITKTTSSSAWGTISISGINLNLQSTEYVNTIEKTDENGKIVANLPFGRYSVREISAPDKYVINGEPFEILVLENSEHEFTVENTLKSKLTVHHYLKQSDGTYTTNKVAEDEIYYGSPDETYSTLPRNDLEGLYIEKNAEGKIVIPSNANGTYGEENQEITYYYEAVPIDLVIHHYVDGTNTKLKDDKTITTKGDVEFDDNGNYTVVANGSYELNLNEEYNELKEKYDLTQIVDSVNGENTIDGIVNYNENTEINYYYRIKQNQITTNVKEHEETDDIGNTRIVKGGTIAGEDEIPYEVVEYGEDSTKEIKIIPDDGYEIKEITINGEPIDFVPEDDGTFALEQFTQVIEDKHVEVEFQKKKGHVKVYHYVEGTTKPIELADGSLAPTEYKTGEFGEIYSTKPHEDITKYTVVTEEVENRQGIYIDGTIEVTYYYRLKDAEVTINHYIVNPDGTKTTNPVPLANGNVAESSTLEGKVDDEYITNAKLAGELDTNYELKETPTNAEGKMTVEPIEVNYYYGLKEAKVIVHHYQEPSETGGEIVKLAEDVTINGHVTDAYTTTQASSEELPRKFELSRKSDNFEGTMTIEPIEVIYYYKTRDAQLNIKYEDYYTHEEISPEEHQTGKVDDDYITSEKTIDGWTYIESTGNETGKLEVDPITVIFYYKKQTKVTVNYIDKTTGEKIKENDGSESTEVKEGVEGDDYETIAKEFRWYILTDPEPTNTEGQMTKDEIVVNYYYVRPETSLIEKHIDVTNNELLASETHEGRVGDEYNIASREFEGYDLVEEKLPTNAEGRYTEEVQEVKYYYIKKARLIVKYIEKYTEEEIPNADGTPSGRDEENHHEGDTYTTEKKTFEGYELEEVPTNANGTLSGGTTEVIYIYKQIAGDVVENHIDKLTGKKITEETKHEGYVGEDYTTSPKDFANYDLVQEDYPTNATGKFREEEQRVTYYYIQKSSVTIRYIDSETNKDIPNEDGTPSKEDKTGHVGDSYTSETKPFNGYILETIPENATGTMTEEPTTVIYYYRKIKFNLKIEKIIKSITVNGVEQQVNGDLAKAEVYRKEVAGQSIQVKYAIRVTNDSEVEGSARVIETVPSGMIMQASKNTSWNVSGTTATLETEQIVPGDEREYEVVLEWKNNGDNIGTKTNNASIVTTNNKYGFEETDTTDNEDTADLIIAVSTGDINYVFGAIGLLIILGGIALTFIKIDDKKKKA